MFQYILCSEDIQYIFLPKVTSGDEKRTKFVIFIVEVMSNYRKLMSGRMILTKSWL